MMTIPAQIANGPEWAQGCPDCSYGLVWVGEPLPIPKDALSVYGARRVQAANGELTFCECKAGVAMRRHLLGQAQQAERMPTVHGFEAPVIAGRS